MKQREIIVKHDDGVVLPAYETLKSAGADLRANNDLPIVIYPFGTKEYIAGDASSKIADIPNRAVIPTGIFVELPDDCEIQIRTRSGLAAKKGIAVLNDPGTIDSDYRGEIGVILVNKSSEPFTVNKGDRIAQMVLVENVVQAKWKRAEKLSETERGEGGFGHTGTK